MTPTRRPLLPLILLGLTACGTLSTPPIPLADRTIALSTTAFTLNQVVYLDQDVFSGKALPAALKGLSLSGEATYQSVGGTLSGLKLYVRSSLSGLPGDCSALPTSPASFVCPPAGEAAQAVGEVSLQAGSPKPFTLAGAALDAAARAGHGYFGVQITGGQALNGESLSLTGLRARARF